MAEAEELRTVVITREIDAPAELLFEAHSKPEHVIKWFGPGDYPLTTCEMDFRVGGKFRFRMTGPDGIEQTPFGGTYLEIVPAQRIVYDNGFEVEGAGRMVVTVTFVPQADGKTLLVSRTVFESKAMHDAHVDMGFRVGTGIALDQFEAHVMAMKAAA